MLGRLGGADVHPQWRAVPLHRQDQLHALAPHGFADRLAPFLACRNVASTKASFQSIRPRWSHWRSNCRQAFSHIPCCCQCRKRRQQVNPLGYDAGMSRQRAPERSRHRMPLRQARFDAQGPRPSRRRRGSKKNSSMRFHSLVGKLMSAVSIYAALQRKYLARGGIYL